MKKAFLFVLGMMLMAVGTPRLLKFLADSYEFECGGECLATWKFFYEGGGKERE